MNNIYVDELPKSCRTCSFQCYGSCLGGRDILNGNPYTEMCHLKRQKPTDCPLKPLTNRLAEERKKVVQEIRKWCKENFDYKKLPNELGCWVAVNREEFFDILDQIKGASDEI